MRRSWTISAMGAEDLEDAARAREKGEQGDSVVDRISAAAKDVIPGDSDPDGRWMVRLIRP